MSARQEFRCATSDGRYEVIQTAGDFARLVFLRLGLPDTNASAPELAFAADLYESRGKIVALSAENDRLTAELRELRAAAASDAKAPAYRVELVGYGVETVTGVAGIDEQGNFHVGDSVFAAGRWVSATPVKGGA